jgi:membrane protease YdiL (CAAX protease family)
MSTGSTDRRPCHAERDSQGIVVQTKCSACGSGSLPAAVYGTLVIAGSFGLSVVFPDLPGYSVTGPSQSLVLVLVSAAGLLVLVAALGWWTLAGFTPPAEWRDLRLYWLPVLLLAAPFVAGVRPIPPEALGLLVVAYVATAVFEEGMWRGVMLGLLRPTGVWQAVLVSSLLFGLGHLGNSALRGISPIIAAQAVGAGVQGVGFAALRLRTNTLWPLIVIHALHDLFLQMGTLPIPLIEVPIDTALLIYGIFLLRRAPSALGLEHGETLTPAAEGDSSVSRVAPARRG